MALFTAEQLTTKTTADAFKKQIYDFLSGVGVSTTAWQELSPLRVLIDAFARLLAVIMSLVVDAIRGGYLGTAAGDWLATTSAEVYGVDKIEAEFAVGEITCDNTAGGDYDEAPGAVIFKNAITGKTYTNTEQLVLPPLTTGVTIAIQATEIGASSNAAPGQISELVTTLLGVTCSNALSVVGQDAEQDDALKQRDLESLAALSPNGPAEAYTFVAKTPSLNGGVTVNRAETLPPPGDGTLTVVIASPLGAVDPTDVAKVQLGIDEHCTPEIVTATVVSAVEAAQAYTTTVYIDAQAGLTAAQVATLVKPALMAFINSLPIGGVKVGADPGKIFWRRVVGVIEAASPAVLQATLSSEADVTLGLTDVATLAEASVTVNVVLT